MIIRHFYKLISGGVALLLLSSCNGILGGIYDEPLPEESKEYGFISKDEATHTGTIYIDASDYVIWNYIDFSEEEVTVLSYTDEAPAEWDFAVHRYDVKTNGGAVAETSAVNVASMTSAASVPASSFVADIWTTDRISVDMSGMMDGVILYAEDYYNTCLSQWLDVDTSTMPPIYTMSNKVYLLRMADGTYAAIKLQNFMNDAAVKGFMTIEYKYPVEL